MALSECDGITVPNAYGRFPLIHSDPARPAVNRKQYDYWDHVEYIVDQANARGMYIAMLPSWGSWVNGTDRSRPVLTPANARAYGEFLAGDSVSAASSGFWEATGVLMTFHPPGSQTSSTWFHNDRWLAFNMQQDGHNPPAQSRSWEKVARDYGRFPVKPVIDGEPLYEDHPLAFRAKELGYSFDAQVRQYAYADTFSGACGHTYGNHAVWQMYEAGRQRINGPLMYWTQAVMRPGAAQMQFVRALLESRPYLSRVPDQSIVVDPLDGADHISATRGDGYLFVYSAQGRKFAVRPAKISGARLNGWWYNPRSGSAETIGEFDNNHTLEFTPPSEGFGSDWILVLDDAEKSFAAPGR